MKPKNYFLLFALLAGLAGGCLLPAAHGGDIAGSFPADVRVVIRADVPKVRANPVMAKVIARKTGGAEEFIKNIKTWTGVDLDRVRTCWIGVEKENQAIIVLEGEFDETAVENAVLNIDTAQVVQRPGIPFAVMLPDDKRPGEFNLAALLNGKTIVLGLPDLVDTFLAAWTGTQPGLPPDRAKWVAAVADSTAAVDAVVFELAAKDRKKTPWLELFSRAVITADMQENLELKLRLGVKNPAAADPIRKIVEGLRDVYRCLPPEQRKFNAIIEALLENSRVAIEQGDVLVRIAVPRETVDQIAREKHWIQ